MKTDTNKSQRKKSINYIRWTARIFSAIIIPFALFIFIGEAIEGYHNPNAQPLSTFAILSLTSFGIGLLGLALAWKWETTGSILSLLAFILTITIPLMGNQGGNFGIFFIFPLNSILFLISAFKDNKNKNT